MLRGVLAIIPYTITLTSAHYIYPHPYLLFRLSSKHTQTLISILFSDTTMVMSTNAPFYRVITV